MFPVLTTETTSEVAVGNAGNARLRRSNPGSAKSRKIDGGETSHGEIIGRFETGGQLTRPSPPCLILGILTNRRRRTALGRAGSGSGMCRPMRAEGLVSQLR